MSGTIWHDTLHTNWTWHECVFHACFACLMNVLMCFCFLFSNKYYWNIWSDQKCNKKSKIEMKTIVKKRDQMEKNKEWFTSTIEMKRKKKNETFDFIIKNNVRKKRMRKIIKSSIFLKHNCGSRKKPLMIRLIIGSKLVLKFVKNCDVIWLSNLEVLVCKKLWCIC